MVKQTKLDIGTIVKLKSGGPEMTVEKVIPGSGYRCQWFAGKKLESGFFPSDSVESVEPKTK